MEVSFLQIADYASITQDLKLNVMGIFSNIMATNFPTAHPEMYVVAQLTARSSEYNRAFKLGIKLLDEDGHELFAFVGDQKVPEGNGLPVNMNTLLRLNNILFPKPGTYEFSVQVDGDTKGTLPINLIQVTPPES